MIQLPDRFDDIRPYYDSEVPAAMERIASDPLLVPTLKYLGKENEAEEFRNTLRGIKSTVQLQETVMLPVVRQVISRTITEFSYQGIENVDTSRGQLFISNHRDIAFDALLEQLAFMENGIPTSHVTFGSNLMKPQFIVDAGLSNKMFRTIRKSNDFDAFIESSLHLSDYINYVVGKGETVWIAQRNGRTKDGHDKTEPGLVRMLLLGGKRREVLERLGITPVSVSYQWEPCDILKAVELYKSRDGREYVKAPGEDLDSIVTGLVSPKGKVCLTIGRTLDFSGFPDVLGRAEISEAVRMIDDSIYSGYKLWDTNYAAYDILHGTAEHSSMYTAGLKDEFICKMEKDIGRYPDLDAAGLREIYLKIYAGPVDNTEKQTQNL